MNERIQKLLKQAKRTTAEQHDPGSSEYEREVYVCFAELIVQECMMVCGAVAGAAVIRRPNDAFGEGADHSKTMIAKHFGVKS